MKKVKLFTNLLATVLFLSLGGSLSYASNVNGQTIPPKEAFRAEEGVVLKEDFESTEIGSTPLGWVAKDIDGDGATFSVYKTKLSFIPNQTHTLGAAVKTENTNDWVITKEISLSKDAFFTYEVSAELWNNDQDYEILVSSSNNEIANFTKVFEGVATGTAGEEKKVSIPASTKYIAIHLFKGADKKINPSYLVCFDNIELKEKQNYAVTVTAENGDFDVTGFEKANLSSVPEGTELTFTPRPNSGYELVQVIANGQMLTAPYKIEVTKETTISFEYTMPITGETIFNEDFEENQNKDNQYWTPRGWTKKTGYGSESDWLFTKENPHAGEGAFISHSIKNGEKIKASNLLYSPKLSLEKPAKLTFWVRSATGQTEGDLLLVGIKSSLTDNKYFKVAQKAVLGEWQEVSMNIPKETTSILFFHKDRSKGEIVIDDIQLVGQGTADIPALVTYKVTIEEPENGTITVKDFNAEDLKALHGGTNIEFIVTPNEGYELDKLMAGEEDITDSKSFEVNADITITAKFIKKMPIILEENFNGNTEDDDSWIPEGWKVLDADGDKDTWKYNKYKGLPNKENITGAFLSTSYRHNDADNYLILPRLELTSAGKLYFQRKASMSWTYFKEHFSVLISKTDDAPESFTETIYTEDLKDGNWALISLDIPQDAKYIAIRHHDIVEKEKDGLVIDDVVLKGEGSLAKTYPVTLNVEGEGGTIAVEGYTEQTLKAVASGSELTIVATPEEGYELESLKSGDTDLVANGNKIVVNEPVTVTATFKKKTYTVTLNQVEGGTIAIEGNPDLTKVEYGTSLTVVVTPTEGYKLKTLMLGDKDIAESKTFVVKEDGAITPTFEKIMCKITLANPANGILSVVGVKNYYKGIEYGTEISIKVTPMPGYELATLTANGKDIKASDNKFVVKEDVTVDATFVKKLYTITLKQGEGGTIAIQDKTADELTKIEHATTLTVLVTPNEGYVLQSLTANGEDITESKQFAVRQNIEVVAVFEKIKTFTVTLEQSEGGTIAIKGKTAEELKAVRKGTELMVEVSLNEHYTLKTLMAGDVDITEAKKFVVKSDVTIKATFQYDDAVATIEDSSVTIYPNPAQDFLKVESEETNALVRITTMEGKVVFEGRTDEMGKATIKVSAFARGNYILSCGAKTQIIVLK